MMICLLHLFVRNMKLTYMIYLHSLLHNWAGLGWAGLFFFILRPASGLYSNLQPRCVEQQYAE